MRKNRRAKKKDLGGFLGLLTLVVVFAGIAFLIASPSASHIETQTARGEDAFYGSITNVPFKHESTGVVKADTNCKPVEDGLTNCIAIINSSDGTELHFNYTHDMSRQPCLAPGDHVTIMLLSDGTVKLVRR